MPQGLKTEKIMLIYNVLAATAAAALAAMGVGGGGLAVIYLVLVLGVEQKTAQGINLVFFVIASLCSIPFHAKNGRIKWKIATVFAITGAFGAVFGCIFGAKTASEAVRTAFGVFLIISGALALYGVAKNLVKTSVYKRFFGK